MERGAVSLINSSFLDNCRGRPEEARGPTPECTAGAAIKNLLGIDVKPDAAFLERGGNDSHERG
jgi:hypothetical protein